MQYNDGFGFMLTEFQKKPCIWICNSPCECAVSQLILPIYVAVKVVTMHTLLYGGHAEYDNNYFTNVKTTVQLSNRGPLEYTREPEYQYAI